MGNFQSIQMYVYKLNDRTLCPFQDYIQHHLPNMLHRDQVTGPVKAFIHACIKCMSAMSSLNEPLDIFWIPKGDPIDSSKFDMESGKSGQICDWTVWPAVITVDGSVIRKGTVIPI